jgi:hypothetical protein
MADRIAIAPVITAVVAVFGTVAVDARLKVSLVDSSASAPTRSSQPGAGTILPETYYFLASQMWADRTNRYVLR